MNHYIKPIWIIILLNSILFAISSCATLPDEPLSKGEVRLIRIDIPDGENVRANLPFAVKVTFISEEKLDIQKACFYWSDDGPYCYKISSINFEPRGTFMVWLRTDKLGIYNLECFVQYVYTGELRTSNLVSTQISLR